MYTPRNPFFSEFSYGYALTEDLIIGQGTTVSIAPIFPSLIEEGQIGFDVLLERNGIPLFLQFKLAHHIVRRTAFEVRNGFFEPPLYRMHLRCRDETNQHSLLLDLESEGNEVYYSAPAFHLREQLDEAYRLRHVWDRSFQIKPSEIGALSQEDHHVSFQKPGQWRVFSAESSRGGESLDSKAVSNNLARDLREKRPPRIREQLHRLDASMLKIFRERKDESADWRWVSPEGIETQLTPLRRISYLARSFFDCQFFVATEKVQP
jgi:hypothetical protein